MQENNNQDVKLNENSIIAVRKEKLSTLRQNKNAYTNKFKRDVLANCLLGKYDSKTKAELAGIENKTSYKIAGRIMLKRVMGKASFITIQDMSGRIQVYLKKANLAENVYDEFKENSDIGDIVGITGFVFKTNTAELSLNATEVVILTKNIRPLPDKFHGLSDMETRYRQRYVDLIVNEKSRERFQTRSKIISYIRAYFDNNHFMEVETPMMHSLVSGAAAKPFNTHHNALNMDLCLRIAPELHLKRLIVGGLERVYEINRNFRNEGVSTRHNPEFTMVEFYQAYSDYTDMMSITEELLQGIAIDIIGDSNIEYDGKFYDLSKSFTKMTMLESILKYNPNLNMSNLDNIEDATVVAKELKIKIKDSMGLGKIQTEIFEATVEDNLYEPTFITAYPAEVSPLARKNDENPFFTDRFEFFLGGREVANGFSELNDPEDQAQRFQVQVDAKNSGEEETMEYDKDYIRALEYGMPPTAGEGIGIDRLVMFFTNQTSIRDVILFPHMRNEI